MTGLVKFFLTRVTRTLKPRVRVKNDIWGVASVDLVRACLLVWNSNNGSIGDRFVRDQKCLEFSGWHLVTVVFDQFLQPINNVQVTLLVDHADVARMNESVLVDRLVCCFLIVQVAEHNIWAANANLTRFNSSN